MSKFLGLLCVRVGCLASVWLGDDAITEELPGDLSRCAADYALRIFTLSGLLQLGKLIFIATALSLSNMAGLTL
jgi:hypothetical protein